ncbi:MAG: aspartyl protease family protein [Hyphomonas sp.]|nr:aspartyl protease family protein [Hyphomonas sp.]
MQSLTNTGHTHYGLVALVFGFLLPAGPASAQAPIIFSDGVPSVTVSITGMDGEQVDAPLILDSGAEIIVLDQKLAEKAKLPLVKQVNVSGGTDARSEAGIHLASKIALGESQVDNTPVLMMDMASRGGPFEEYVDGIFSPTAFAPSLTRIDFVSKIVCILPPEDFPDDEASDYTDGAHGGLPQAKIALGNREFMAVIDTGAPDLVILPTSFAEDLPLKTALIESGKSRSVNDENTAFQAQLDGALEISGRRWESPLLTFVEDQSGLALGMGVLAGARLTLDPANQRAWLEWPDGKDCSSCQQ